MSGRRLTTAATLAGLVVIVVGMAVWGIKAATAPIKDTSTASKDPSCAASDQAEQQYVRRGQVTVSVYNTGKRAGRARVTLDKLESAGFKAGAIGNADANDNVVLAEVRTTEQDDKAALLVARALGRNVKVVVTDQDYGPGVDVFIGDRFNRLAKKAPVRLALDTPKSSCN